MRNSLVWPCLVLTFFSSLIVYSVAPNRLIFQLIFFAIGWLIFYLCQKINLSVFINISPYFYFINIILLVLTLFLGSNIRGSVRWLDFGFFRLQMSEWAKLALILFLPLLLVGKKSYKQIIIVFASFALTFGLVYSQPDLGSALVLGVIFLTVFLASKLPAKAKVFFLLLIILLLPLFFFNLKSYQQDRIINFFDPYQDPAGSGYNVIQSVIAIGSGGFWGKGIGLGSQSQLFFLPEKETDFIFAALSEELGFVGGTVVILTYLWLLFLIISLYSRQKNELNSMIILAVFFLFSSQIIINIGMNMGLMPVTGLPLPLMSVGGNAILVNFALLGIIQNLKVPADRSTSLIIGLDKT